MKTIFTLSFILFSTFVCAQNNLIYAELGGASPMLSVNYERQFFNSSHLNFRVGLGGSTVVFEESLIFTVPVGIYFLQDMKKGNFLEVGVTKTIVLNNIDAEDFLMPHIGYRKYYENKKSFLKLTFCPILFDSDEFLPWAGISFGTRF